MEKKVIDLEIIDDLEESGTQKISLVDAPAIEKNWMYFKKTEEFVTPKSGESESDYMGRCVPTLIDEGKEQTQAVAICISTYENMSKVFEFDAFAEYPWDECISDANKRGLDDESASKLCGWIKANMADMKFAKVSFDFDDTLSTAAGLELAKRYKDKGDTLYIISARNEVSSGMLARAEELGIPTSRVYATGSNKAKVEKVLNLGIEKHIDNNADVIKELGSKGEKFSFVTDTFTDYPEAAKENARRALAYAEKNGWGDCGTPVGKARANQLAKGEPISIETVARMASFERHRQNSKTPYGEGCGKLMWDAWGGDEGIAWAQRTLDSYQEEFEINTAGLPAYTQQADKKKKDLVTKSVNLEAILAKAKKLGFSAEDFTTNGLEFHQDYEGIDLKLAKGYTVYKYEGPITSNSRDFCREMVNMNRFYTFDEVNELSATDPNPGFGLGGSDNYSIWKYLGGPNCNHFWQKYYVTEAGAIQNKGKAPGVAGTPMIDRPNNGYAFKKSHKFEEEYATIEEAQARSKELGLNGEIHSHATENGFIYMPGASHEDLDKALASYAMKFAAIEDLKVGDAVSWKTADQNPRGRIKEITYRSKTVPGTDFRIEGTQTDPGYIIEIYEKMDGKWSPTGKFVGRKADSILKNVELWRQSFAAVEDKREIVGPVAIPDMEIFRKDKKGNPYYVRFSKDVIRRMAEKFLKEGRVNSTNVAHENIDAGTYIFESWIVEHDGDKANTIYNLNVPVGSWVVKGRVVNDAVWAGVKEGKFNGWSLEGDFLSKEEYEEYMKNKKMYENLVSLVNGL